MDKNHPQSDVSSGALLVYDNDVLPRVDLRVDVHPNITAELRHVFDLYKPRIRYFQLRAGDPEAADALPRDWETPQPPRG